MEILNDRAAQAEAQGKAQEAGAKGKIEQTKSDLMTQAVAQFKANPQAGGAVIDGILPPALDANANASYKNAYNSAMATGGPDAAQKIVEAAATHAASLAATVNPAQQAAKIKVAQAGRAVINEGRTFQVINKETGQLEMRTADEINSSNGKYTLAGQGGNATEQATVRSLANRVFSEATPNADGTRNLDDVIRNVQKFYANDPEVNQYRPQIIAQLESWKSTGARADQAGQKAGEGNFKNRLLNKMNQDKGPTTAQAASTSAPAQSAAPKSGNQTGTQKFSEAEVRQRALSAGKDAEAAVKLARSKGLIQ